MSKACNIRIGEKRNVCTLFLVRKLEGKETTRTRKT
jgi:hypothetical protein